MNLDDVERRLREIVATIPIGNRAYLLTVLTADDATRADAISNLHATGLAPATVDLLIDAEADPALRALLGRHAAPEPAKSVRAKA